VFKLPATGSFRVLIHLTGALHLRAAESSDVKVDVVPGQAVLLPAAAGEFVGFGIGARFLWVDPQ
jgi:hypothetical protein